MNRSNDSSISNPRAIETYFKPFFATRYWLIASDSTRCEAKDSFQIFIKSNKNVKLADAFSPNADGANDWFFRNRQVMRR
ncbi:MAG: hypothetical protein HC817_14575 [Saprospiraceae bacterium]|nr:hypothetical protein [Saprospiraceae bacterium]